MGKITERIETIKQHHHANRLRKDVIRESADDPDVVFHDTAPKPFYHALHGVNSTEEMMNSAVPVTD